MEHKISGSQFIFGTASVGSKISYKKFCEFAKLAESLGISIFDSAPLYGRGLSQVYIARYLKQMSSQKWDTSSKVGRIPVPDLKTIAIILLRLEFRHLFRVLKNVGRYAIDFSEKGLNSSHQFAIKSLNGNVPKPVFLHSSNEQLSSQIDTLINISESCNMFGISDPSHQDLALIEKDNRDWIVQVSAERFLADPALHTYKGKIWINQIIKYSRYANVAFEKVLNNIILKRSHDCFFVIGFNNKYLFEQVSQIITSSD